MIAAVKSEAGKLAMGVAAYTGVDKGELEALRWEDLVNGDLTAITAGQVLEAAQKQGPYSTASTSTATPSFCLGDPTMMPSTGETSEKSRPTPKIM